MPAFGRIGLSPGVGQSWLLARRLGYEPQVLHHPGPPASGGGAAPGIRPMSASAVPREGSRGELPLIDIHARAIDAPPERVWDVIADPFLPRFGGRAGPLIARLLGCSQVERPPAGGLIPPAVVGFRVAEALRPSLIALEGEHRFSRYALTFRIEPSGATTSHLSAGTRARFPGLSGSLYRAAVIGSGGHRTVVRRLLSVVRLAELA